MIGPAHLNLNGPGIRFRMISGGTQNQRIEVSASMIVPSIRSGISPAVNPCRRRNSQDRQAESLAHRGAAELAIDHHARAFGERPRVAVTPVAVEIEPVVEEDGGSLK